MDLKNKKCIPCEGTEKPLTKEKSKKLLKEINNWKIIDNKMIEKGFSFKDFKEAVKFTNKVAEIAESEGHHPNIYIYDYRKVKISLLTHAIKGLAENDFILAAKIDEIFD